LRLCFPSRMMCIIHCLEACALILLAIGSIDAFMVDVEPPPEGRRVERHVESR
jgi:hypothetical protein